MHTIFNIKFNIKRLLGMYHRLKILSLYSFKCMVLPYSIQPYRALLNEVHRPLGSGHSSLFHHHLAESSAICNRVFKNFIIGPLLSSSNWFNNLLFPPKRIICQKSNLLQTVKIELLQFIIPKRGFNYIIPPLEFRHMTSTVSIYKLNLVLLHSRSVSNG